MPKKRSNSSARNLRYIKQYSIIGGIPHKVFDGRLSIASAILNNEFNGVVYLLLAPFWPAAPNAVQLAHLCCELLTNPKAPTSQPRI